ncbi:FUSC family protein [Acidocella aromatica]|uniref:Putative membrane protein YccC n=1 Tax=Acidocella aromatica TaxID=1303579 RepID=A0A840VEC4_9PROT|nr:FUSC family protein [Acidocella aromatica]MBB5374056.1 putative membrane protein YccC [Acidocella aromatica]
MPKVDEVVFALKTFFGAMAALYLAFWLGLDDPYWAMATAFIVAQPLTGAMRSKAVYRGIGTLVGGTMAVILVPNMVNAPLLLSLGLACWIGLCLYISLLDRSPRAYAFMLAGYTAGIIGFPSVMTPGMVFQTAVTRVEEILLGITCTTTIGTLIFPRAIGPVLAQRIASWVRPGINWASAALTGQEDSTEISAARRKLAVEAHDVAMMISHLAYDTSHLQTAVQYITRLRIYVLSLMPVLSSINDRVSQLRELNGITPQLQDALDATYKWVQAGGPEHADELHAQIIALEETEPSWPGLLRASLAVRLAELVSIIRHARAIRRHVFNGDAAPGSALADAEFVAAATQLNDHGMALLSALAAGIAVLLVCAIWIFTAWPAGAGAAIMVAVACSFFAVQDDPAPAIRRMLINSGIACLGIAFYTFLVLPRVTTFTELMLALLPAGLIVGVLVSRPATFATGMVIGANGSTQMALNNGYTGQFAVYLNSSIGLLFGLAAALVVTRLIRSVGVEWSVQRLLRAGWKDIAAAATATGPQDRAILTGRMTDRLGLMMPRLATVSAGGDFPATLLMRDLRVGLNVIGVQRFRARFPAVAQTAVAEILAGIAAHYRNNPRIPFPTDIRDAIDRAMLAAASDAEPLMELSGLRSLLFADSPPPDLSTTLLPAR